jgi:hypothetical protein
VRGPPTASSGSRELVRRVAYERASRGRAWRCVHACMHAPHPIGVLPLGATTSAPQATQPDNMSDCDVRDISAFESKIIRTNLSHAHFATFRRQGVVAKVFWTVVGPEQRTRSASLGAFKRRVCCQLCASKQQLVVSAASRIAVACVSTSCLLCWPHASHTCWAHMHTLCG